MFSFHKPKVYRSTQGCCICKAKSSSSRFTDSKKYENDFKECFQLLEPRQGEICNACVLLVKRFKRLPLGNRRHWSHVVDARIGPGIKSMTKFKKRKEEQMLLQNGSTEFAGQSITNVQNIRNNTTTERFGKIFKKKKKTLIATRSCDENSQPTSPTSSSSDNDDNRLSDDASDRLECDEEMSPIDDDVVIPRNQRKQKNPIKNRKQTTFDAMHIIDSGLWKQRKTCCGYFYENKRFGAILVETSQYSMNLCSVHAKKVPSVCEKKEELMMLSPAIKSLPPKKQHFLRQCMIETTPIPQPIEQSAPIDYSRNTVVQGTNDSRVLSNLQKIRGETGKVVKKTPKKKLAELNAAKNLVKLCTATKIANAINANPNAPNVNVEKLINAQNAANEHNENKNITNTVNKEPIATSKYSDNSSDSGYEETLHDTTQLNQIAKIGTTRPVILSNGVKLHVKPENLLLAANLAGVSQTAIQTTQASMKAMSAQKHQKGSVPLFTAQSNVPTTSTNSIGYKCINPVNVGDISKKAVFMVPPNVLTVTNNS